MNTEEIRRGLRNIKTRPGTIDAVAEKGDAVIDNILPLLQDRNEGVRWSAIRIMSEIGDNRAVGPLITLLEQSKNAVDAVNALRSITGQDFGEESGEWRNWATQDPKIRNTAGAGIFSDQDLLTEATRDLSVTVSGQGPQYTVAVSLLDGRSQKVWIDFSCKTPDGQSIVQLCTPCGDADQQKYEAVLKQNMAIPYGAIAIASLDDAICFAMVDSYLRKTVHPEDISASIMSLAVHGDSLEKSLSGKDRF
ncbi:HEAT repeat domain-containing protein [Verrucomicrobiota bacterium]